MKATQQLKDEHEGIRLMLRILERVCERIEEGREADPEHLPQMLDFFRIFVDKCHHGKEEDHLFPALEAVGVPREGGPIGVMLMEHQMGRERVKAMGQAVEDGRENKPDASRRVGQESRAYISLLNQHIEKENNVLFPMADQRLSVRKQEELFEAFERLEVERIGIGKHEEFHKLLEHLSGIYLR
jgi:hemerythrin-like domain-containing protein